MSPTEPPAGVRVVWVNRAVLEANSNRVAIRRRVRIRRVGGVSVCL